MRLLRSIRKNPSSAAPASDEHLLAAIARGDLAAFEELHRSYFPKLMHFSRRITSSYEAAEEVANDTLMVVWRSAQNFEGRSKPSSWIFGIAYRQAMKKRQSLERHKDDIMLDDQLMHDGHDTAADVLRRKDIGKALQQLTPELRAVVELTYYNGYYYTEIAEILGCPVGTVKTRMMAARKKLRIIMSDEEQTKSESAVA